MSEISTLPLPEWARNVATDPERERERLCFLLRLAALYHNPRSSLTLLSRAVGQSDTAMHMSVKRGSITGEMAVAIERELGRELFPRELFRPDLFSLPVE